MITPEQHTQDIKTAMDWVVARDHPKNFTKRKFNQLRWKAWLAIWRWIAYRNAWDMLLSIAFDDPLRTTGKRVECDDATRQTIRAKFQAACPDLNLTWSKEDSWKPDAL